MDYKEKYQKLTGSSILPGWEGMIEHLEREYSCYVYVTPDFIPNEITTVEWVWHVDFLYFPYHRSNVIYRVNGKEEALLEGLNYALDQLLYLQQDGFEIARRWEVEAMRDFDPDDDSDDYAVKVDYDGCASTSMPEWSSSEPDYFLTYMTTQTSSIYD